MGHSFHYYPNHTSDHVPTVNNLLADFRAVYVSATCTGARRVAWHNHWQQRHDNNHHQDQDYQGKNLSRVLMRP
jgi:hypothetical protein